MLPATLSVVSTASIASTASVVQLLRKTSLTADEQHQIEDAITAIAQQRGWAHHTAAWSLHRQAFPD